MRESEFRGCRRRESSWGVGGIVSGPVVRYKLNEMVAIDVMCEDWELPVWLEIPTADNQ
jgi:hypothetical protein